MKFCSAPWDTIAIQSDGWLTSCLCGEWNTAGNIGNILHTPIVEIMRSEPVSDLRSSVRDQSFAMCRDQCPRKWTLDSVDQLPTPTLPLPTTILLAIDRECNLRCPSCRPSRTWTGRVNPTAMRILDAITETYKDHTQPVTLQCDGAGDVFASAAWNKFLSQESLPECFRLHVITNGNLVVKRLDLLDQLRDRINSVDVSLDANHPDTYTVVRGGKLDIVFQGMRAMLAKGIRVNVSFVVQQKNYREMLECWRTVSDMGCHSINFQGVRRWGHHTDTWWQENRLQDNPAVDTAVLKNNVGHLLQAPTTVSLNGQRGLCPVHMDGNIRLWA